MLLQVHNTKTIGAVQQAFNAAFPFLKLVFFSKPHNALEGSPAKYILDDPERTMESLQKTPREGNIEISDTTATWEVEHFFENEFGIHVQVFRKSGSLWLETSRTDSLSLLEQNKRGEASEHIQPLEAEIIDIREQE